MIEVAAKLYIGDVVEMRKVHPCGGYVWEIVRVGADIGIVCRTCGRRVLLQRARCLWSRRRALGRLRRRSRYPRSACATPRT